MFEIGAALRGLFLGGLLIRCALIGCAVICCTVLFTPVQADEALPVPVDRNAPWVGKWAADPAWCADADKIGRKTPAPVELTPTEFLGYENSCTITKVVQPGSMQAWLLKLECQSEGSVYDDEMLVAVNRDGRLWWIDGASEPAAFTRCE